MAPKLYRNSRGFFSRGLQFLLVRYFRRVNRFRPWHRLPTWQALFNLLALREELRAHNLIDTDGDLTRPKPGCPFDPDPPARTLRTASGTQNDLHYSAMGCRGSRLGRNVARALTAPDLARLMVPNPLLVSEKLLARETFKPATSLNLLAAAWIQFEVHDWFNHEKEQLNSGHDLHVPRAGDWPDPAGMTLVKTKPDPARLTELDDKYPAYRNADPQWWDGSQVYGSTDEETLGLRSDCTDPIHPRLCPRGHLSLDKNGFLPTDPASGATVSGFTDNWWLGLEILHTLFAREHNAICDHLAAKEKKLTDDEIFQKARLINCALMAKIHTLEWTPAILAHPAIQPALNTNWMGFIGHFFGEGTARATAPFLPGGFAKDLLTGIPMSETDHQGAPYALTEEFAAVYRLHPLIPDEVRIVQDAGGKLRATYKMSEITFTRARQPFQDGASMEDVIYSFGISHPGAITIKNFPNFLRNLELPADPVTGLRPQIDLAAVDILRDRERGVPRYNEFRRQLRKEPVRDWDELVGGDKDLAAQLESVYEGRLEDVDTMVGMLCEPLPAGFGFSDTAFRIFILMASRRLKGDRFFTSDYREEFYTAAGLEWIRRTGIKEIVLRHHPDLAEALANIRNPFSPWIPTNQ